MRYIISLLLLVTTATVFGQHTNFNTQRNWSLNKKEIIFGLGATQFLGDLGGRDRVGTDFSLVDIDWPSTGIGGMVGYRLRFHPYWAWTSNINVGLIRGNDALTNEIIRESRNLHFRSIVVETQQRIEAIVLANEKFGARYKIPGLKHMRDRNEQIYLFTGVGVNYFNPKANFEGDWVALRKLNTEGQGQGAYTVYTAEGAEEYTPPKQYLPVTVTIPFGIGLRMGLGRMWRVGIEATYVKTFSDYMDDVSGFYYDPDKLGDPGSAASYLSNPAQTNVTWFAPGQQRGDPDEKDAYFYLNIVFAKNITYKNYNSYNRQVKWRGRYKF